MRTIHRDIVTALIFSKDGKLLQGMKDPARSGVYPDCWHIPGGGIEDGEDKIMALTREIREETGIDISPYEAILIDDQGTGESEKVIKGTNERVICKMKFYVYKVVIDGMNADEISIQLNDDLVMYRWSKLSELHMLNLTPPSAILFRRLGYIKSDLLISNFRVQKSG